ncbi:hypothetical protein HanPSC8_Chr11g0467501 [Helianthus annuus]|nr:hypothetical protein HanPSC8_Chr11g0467501 [Helianthus annuus]
MKRPSDSVVEIISSLFGWIIHRYKHKECTLRRCEDETKRQNEVGVFLPK